MNGWIGKKHQTVIKEETYSNLKDTLGGVSRKVGMLINIR
jgi:hypothetical protein